MFVPPESSGGEARRELPPVDNLPRTPLDLIDSIREAHRKRHLEMRSEGDAMRRINSVCKRAAGCSLDATPPERKRAERDADEAVKQVLKKAPASDAAIAAAPLLDSILAAVALFKKSRAETEKMLRAWAEQTHVAKFVNDTPGFGFLGLGQIIGEAGDLSAYATPAKLWKRFGLGLISSGERQRKFADEAKAKEAGYSPRRRSLMFVIGDSLIKKKGPYRDLYLARKAYEQEKAPTLTKMAWHRRAQRYTEKRLLRDLWRAWHQVTVH
jgi:hypothetical protein